MGSNDADRAARDDVRHLGTFVGGGAHRIVALSTSAVFGDASLTRTYWGVRGDELDSGFQGHLYTRPGDVLVIRVPDGDERQAAMALAAIEVNRELWAQLRSVELCSSLDPLLRE